MGRSLKAEAIRQLNDALRCQGTGGAIMMTQGIEALGPDMLAKVMAAIRGFDAFTRENDPHREHDCAVMDIDGIEVMWKIDYYDLALSSHPPDPADPAVTKRVMTVMLAEEY